MNAAARPILLLLSSNFLGAFVGGLFLLFAVWNFDLEQMGRYGVAITIQWVAVGLVGTGLSVATIRLTTTALLERREAVAAGIVALALGTSVTVTAVLAATCEALARLGVETPWLGPRVLALVVLWAGARSAIDCERSGLLAQRAYGRAAVLMVLSAVTGSLALAAALMGGPLTLERLLLAHVAGLGSAAALGLPLLGSLGRSGVEPTRESFRSLVAYGRWPALSEGTRMLQANLGPILLTSVSGLAQAGLFSVGRYPAYLFEVVGVSLYQYWLPEAARDGGRGALARFLGRQMRLAAAVGGLMILAALAAWPVLPWLGGHFAQAGPLFVISTLDFALSLLVRPIESVCHGLYRPRLELAFRLVRLPVLIVAGWVLARHHGAIGMAWAHVLTGAVGLAVAAPWTARLLREERRRNEAAADAGS